MTLNEFLLALVSGSIVVPTIKNLIDWQWIKNTKFNKNILAFLLPLLLATGGYAGLIYTGVEMQPETVHDWLEALWPVFSSAYVTGQAIYKYLVKK